MTPLQYLEHWYREMYELTNPECKRCRCPLSCCDTMYCELAEQYTKERYGVTLSKLTNDPRLPFMGLNGCSLPPHYRPLCTLHTCDVNNLGFKRGDKAWTKRYFQLRTKIDILENHLPLL